MSSPSNQTLRAAARRAQAHRLVPWLNWEEWDYVRESLFSSSAKHVDFAIRRIAAWRSRGHIPVEIKITSSFIEIQQKDPYFSLGMTQESEEMLAMLYTMAIVRLVNGVIEKSRKRERASIAEAARSIGLPRELIDIRHEGSHRDLPSLQLVRIASIQAVEWLKSYYWDPQKNAILCKNDEAANVRRAIEHRLHEVAIQLKSRQSSHSKMKPVKGKGSKKSTKRTIKGLVRLYSSFSSEIVSLLLQFLNSAVNSSVLVDLPEGTEIGENKDSSNITIDDWKFLILRFSKKEPKLLLDLLSALLDSMDEAPEGGDDLMLVDDSMKSSHVERLSSLILWLVEHLKGLRKSQYASPDSEGEESAADMLLPDATLRKFLFKCLLMSAHSRSCLMNAVLLLGQLMGNKSLLKKLNKLSLVGQSSDAPEGKLFGNNSSSFFKEQDDSLLKAAEKLELIKCKLKGMPAITTENDTKKQHRWTVTKSWRSCPIGMLPGTLGHPVLPNLTVVGEFPEKREHWELIQCTGKREASSQIELDTVSTKKMRRANEGCTTEAEDLSPSEAEEEGVKNQLLIGGAWKKVNEAELLAIKSSVRILV